MVEIDIHSKPIFSLLLLLILVIADGQITKPPLLDELGVVCSPPIILSLSTVINAPRDVKSSFLVSTLH